MRHGKIAVIKLCILIISIRCRDQHTYRFIGGPSTHSITKKKTQKKNNAEKKTFLFKYNTAS